jgi:competence protein ComEA
MTMAISFDSPSGTRSFAGRKGMRNAFAYALVALMLWTGTAGAADPDPARAPIDLNRATAEELESLPGIGAAKAAAIVEAREAQGGFASLEDLESVRGVGPALMAKLRPLVVVGGAGAKAPGKASTPAATK